MIERAPQLTEYLSDAAAAHFERVQEGLDVARHRARARAPPGARLRLLHVDHVRVRERRARRGAERGRRRRPLRPARRGHGRSAHAGHRVRDRHRASAHRARGRSRWRRHRAITRRALDAFVVDGVGDGSATVLVAELRADGLAADRAYGGRSVKAQWKLADRSGARFGVMLGRREAEHDAVGGEGPASRASSGSSRGASWPGWLQAAGRGRTRTPARRTWSAQVMRTHRAGDVRPEMVGETGGGVRLGRAARRDHGGVVFLDLRDTAGHRAGGARPGRSTAPTRTACAASTASGSRARCATAPRAR